MLKELARSLVLRFPELRGIRPLPKLRISPPITEPGIETLRDADLLESDGIIRLPDGTIYAASFPYRKELRDRTWRLRPPFIPSRPQHRIEGERVYGAGMWTLAHHHWLFEAILPLLAFEIGDAPILVPSGATERHIELLRAFGLRNEIERLEGRYTKVGILRVPFIPEARQMDLAHLLRDAVGDLAAEGCPKRIYLSRDDTPRRRLVNESEVFGRLAQLGFEKLVMTEHPYREQLRYLANADLIVGVHGAAFSNLFAARPGTAVIEILPQVDFASNTTSLCQAFDLRYTFVSAATRGSDVWVKPEVLESVVRRSKVFDNAGGGSANL